MPSQIAALVFDMDGTLVDNMRYHEQSWVEFFKRRGRDIDPESFFKQTAGRHNREIMLDWIGASLTQEELAALAEEKESLYRELYAPHRKAVIGFEAFAVQARAAGLKLAVATSAPPANVAFILDALDLRKYFDVVVDSSGVKRGKPHPDIYLAAARQLAVPAECCIAFEDAPAGVASAQAAGMPCVVLTTYLPARAFAQHRNSLVCVPDFTHLNLATLLGVKAA
jgi:beta-phosphoglucomutase family hydrolase